MVQDRNTAIFYTTAVCNLKCKYCVIDKNPVLKKIDEVLEESFKGDYYFNFTKELFPDKNQLKRVEIWGGEPYLGMHRIYYTLEKLLDYFPNIEEVFGSTNLIATNFVTEVIGLLKVLGKAKHKITFKLQLSLDGPKNITDLNRGTGTTEKFAKRLIELAPIFEANVPDNVELLLVFKPTLDKYSLRLLDSRENIIKYYDFFENFYSLYDKVTARKPNIKFLPTIPNFAMPSDFTQEDGFFFRDLCKMTRELEKEHLFRHLTDITLFSRQVNNEYLTLPGCLTGDNNLCGTGRLTVGMLPNRMVSMCHMAFVDFIGEYKQAVLENKTRETTVDENMFNNYYANMFCFPVEQLDRYETMINDFYAENTTAKLATITTEIMMLALSGQIQEKYKKQEDAIKAAHFIASHVSFCVKDNLGAVGSTYLIPIGTLQIFLNGAEDYIMNNTGV